MYRQTDHNNRRFCINTQLISCLYTLLYYYLGLIKKSGVTNVWLGGTDQGVEGTWVWTDTSPGIIFQ